MSRPIAPSQSLMRSLIRTPPRAQPQQQCRRLLSSRVSSPITPHPAAPSTSGSLPRTQTRPCPTILLPPPPPRQIVQKEQRRYKRTQTVEEAKSRYRTGPFSWKAGLLFVATAGGLVWYFESEKGRMQRKRTAEATKGIGRPKVGGEFELVDHEGRPFASGRLTGRYSLIYFGFTHCPDICPEELDKMARMFDLVEAEAPGAVTPVFITCDPERDDPKTLKSYLAEFHPRFLGLTGTYDQIRDVCKSYRVYFSTPRGVEPGRDYLVDHSIYFYLMDPEGDFVEALGRQHSPDAAAKIILGHVKDWRGGFKAET